MNINKKNFYLYALGRLVSIIGSGIQMIAIPLFILDLTGSGTIMGTFVLVSNLPRLIFGPFAGVLGDRFDRKKIMVMMDFARGAIILLLAVMTRMDALQISGLLIAQFIISTMDITFDPATQAMLGDIVHNNDLNKANSIIQGINSFSFIVGPAMGGILYGLFGIEVVFLINGISFVLSALSEMFISYHQTTERGKVSIKSTLIDI
ncbi:MAG: MFS transporter, partial [Thermotogota bacterium]